MVLGYAENSSSPKSERRQIMKLVIAVIALLIVAAVGLAQSMQTVVYR